MEEFIEKLRKAEKEHPYEAEKALRKGGRNLLKAIKEDAPNCGHEHAKKLSDDKSWTLRTRGIMTKNLENAISSKSPHFHLVDRGHVQKNRQGKVVGFTQGTHFLKKTLDTKGKDVQEEMGAELLKKLKENLS